MLETEVNEMVKSIITTFANERPELAKTIIIKKPFLTAVSVSDGVSEESYAIIDFTSNQEAHMHDLQNYSTQLYRQFEESYGEC